jgi:hypothetical protein
MRFLNAVSVVLGSVRVCGRVAALGGATSSAVGLGGGGGFGFGFGFGCAAVAWPTVAAALAVTDAVLLTVAAVPPAVAAQPVRAPAASTAPTIRHLTSEEHTRIGGACTLRNGVVPDAVGYAVDLGAGRSATPSTAAISVDGVADRVRPRSMASVTGAACGRECRWVEADWRVTGRRRLGG